ncbi:MAG: FAD-binding protein [Planctomycetes bacterium]|nr:FAD-binding protein [Planctomycetota bacterium]
MDQERSRVQADLRGLLRCDVHCDDVALQLYASDASIYELRPLGVVRPRGVEDVVTCLQYAHEHNLPVHARGAGTGLAGESLGPGLVVDFAHAMRRIVRIDADEATFQPGIVLADLNRLLAPRSRHFGPDPSTRSVTTMGSVLAIDASGSHWPQYGSPRRHVERLQVALADGTVIEAGRHVALEGDTDPARAALVGRLHELLRRDSQTIRANQPRSLVNRGGYHLDGIARDGELDLASLFIGSEGTLGLIVEATVRTSPIPRHRGLVLLFFDRLDNAARAALEIAQMGASTCDLMDRRLLTIARETEPRFESLLPRDAEGLLLVEHHGDEADDVRQRMDAVIARIRRRRRLAYESRATMDRDERNFYWRLARRVVPMLYRLKGNTRPLPFIEDLAVPPAALPDFLATLQNVLKAHEVIASLFAHAAHGQLHVRPFLDLADPADVRKMQGLASDVYERVMEVGGTISGEHGLGLSRTWYARRQYGPLYDVFREVKRVLDPRSILNPGKVVADVPQPLTKNLRAVRLADRATADRPDEAPPAPLLAWSVDQVMAASRECNGCGRCRTSSNEDRMCPVFRVAAREEASPRSKANLLRGALTGRLEGKQLTSDETKAVADLCFHCHQCRVECPAGVDIPMLAVELKAQYVAVNGLDASNWFLARLDRFAPLASRFALVSNWILGNRQARWLLERMTGIARGRKLPTVAPRSFLRQAQRRRLHRSTRANEPKVLYFVDLYANWFDGELATAVVDILEHNGVRTYVPPNQVAAGMHAIAVGAVERAARLARRNVALLAEAVRQGYTIVTTEPSAAMCLRHDYPRLLGDEDAKLVAEHAVDAGAYLWNLHQRGRLELDLKPLNATVGYHLPCHLRACHPESPGENLLRLIHGLTVRRIEQGCSGMAGTWGFQRRNFRASLRIGWNLIAGIRDLELQVGATECSACRVQMAQGAAKPILHPLKILAMAYGLLPYTAERWSKRLGDDLAFS